MNGPFRELCFASPRADRERSFIVDGAASEGGRGRRRFLRMRHASGLSVRPSVLPHPRSSLSSLSVSALSAPQMPQFNPNVVTSSGYMYMLPYLPCTQGGLYMIVDVVPA